MNKAHPRRLSWVDFLECSPKMLMALWWGSLSSIGFVVVPLLFIHLPSPALAGNMAATLFSAQNWIAIGCGMVLLLLGRSRHAPKVSTWTTTNLPWLLLACMAALVIEYGVAPRIVARENLALWHNLGTGLYLLEWVCCSWLMLKTR